MLVSDVGNLRWFKSSYSAVNGNCVEVAYGLGAVFVRDSKTPSQPELRFSPNEWWNFVMSVRAGEFDSPAR